MTIESYGRTIKILIFACLIVLIIYNIESTTLHRLHNFIFSYNVSQGTSPSDKRINKASNRYHIPDIAMENVIPRISQLYLSTNRYQTSGIPAQNTVSMHRSLSSRHRNVSARSGRLKTSDSLTSSTPFTIIVTRKEKIILLYNPKHWEILMRDFFHDIWKDCEYRCDLTSDRGRFQKSDAVVFVIDTLPSIKTMPPKIKNQVWIFAQYESADYLEKEIKAEIMRPNVMKLFDRKVNWTLGYRRDSDIVFVMGDYKVKSKPAPKNDNLKSVLNQKSRTAAWFVSHCGTISKRESYVKLMRNTFDIDQFGACNRRNLQNCPKQRINAIREAWGMKSQEGYPGTCLKILDTTYRFYLSFENTLCRDYITEKALHHVIQHNVIPVVRSGANHSIFSPPNSYIDTNKFDSVNSLTNYLNRLLSNQSEMMQYFEWKRFYDSDYSINNWKRSICNICKRLQNPKKYYRIYENLYEWIIRPNGKQACHGPNDIK